MAFAVDIDPDKKRSLHALEATNFFLADVQTRARTFSGAAYLAGGGMGSQDVSVRH